MENPQTEQPQDPLELSFLTKEITSEASINHWLQSQAYNSLYGILELLCHAIASKPRSTSRTRRPIIDAILGAIARSREIMEEVKPLEGQMRFGNRAFRLWLTRIYEERAAILGGVTQNAEIWEYFVQSFGSWTRIDYGTGHEFNFLAFITALFITGDLKEEDALCIVFDVFWAYWDLVNDLQKRYNQEPAGSHGSWGLDDYVALPFVFGAWQLIDHEEVVPSNVINQQISHAHADEYAYCRWIDYIYQGIYP